MPRTLLHILMAATVFCVQTSCSKQQESRLPEDATILAFGDSLTAGTGAAKGQDYPSVLANLTGRTVINAGLSGELSSAGKTRLEALLQKNQPDLLLLCHGGNDLLQGKDLQILANNLTAMIQMAQDKNIPVVLIAVPAPKLPLTPPALYAETAQGTKSICDEKILRDILGQPKLKADYVHPNAAGYRLFAERIVKLLQSKNFL